METNSDAELLRIFLGEDDKYGHISMFEAIVREAKKSGLAGATVFRGILSFGASSHIRTNKILDLSSDLPIIVEIADKKEKIEAFIPKINEMFERSGCGGLVTIEKVKVLKYTHGKIKK